jgi:hydroxymethylbilane synthase
MKEIKVLSRSSFLAQIQTHLAITKIKTIFKGSISTHYTESIGDTDNSSKSWEKHGFGVFTNSLSKQLHLNKADLVVHSFKDLPVKSSKKSKFICLNRDDPRDVLLVKKKSIRKPSSTIATSSPRRKFYLRHLDEFLPNKKFKSNSIRGNITTRLEKIILSTKHDGVFMAKAAIDRVFQYGQKINNQEFQKFKKYFNQFEYIILPLSNFPAAAAQGMYCYRVLS